MSEKYQGTPMACLRSTFINSTYSRTYNVLPTQPSFTLVAEVDAVKESSVKHRLTNPKIQALLKEIINDDDPYRNVTP